MGLIDKMHFVIKIEGDKILDIDTLLFTKSEILGRIEDIFGSIHEPMYTVLSDGYLNQLWD
jgi:rRNA processing protein Gar1